MQQILLINLGFKLAWTFSEVLAGDFERDRKEALELSSQLLVLDQLTANKHHHWRAEVFLGRICMS